MFSLFNLLVTPFQQNARVLACPKSHEAVVVDPGGDVPIILNCLSKQQLKCTQIWLTHAHLDHSGGVADLIAASGAKLFGHETEREMRATVENIALMYGIEPAAMRNCPEPDEYINEGGQVSFSSYTFKIFFTPGHSPGHVVFYHAPSATLIAGDTLFAGSIGRTDLPGGNHQQLLQSIKQKILSLPDNTKVLSGHGPDTTVGVERKSNPFLVGSMP